MKIPFRIQRHPTGFLKAVLFEGLGRTIRIHFWPKGRNGVRPDVHGHRFRFVSVPILGTFVERRYERTGRTDHAIVNCADNGGILEDGGRGGIRVVSTTLRKPFRPYACGLDQIHDFEPASDRPSLTIVFMGRRRKDRAPVYQPASP